MEINGLVKRIHANNGTKYRNNDQKYCGNSKTRIPRHVINNNSIATTQTRRPIQTRSLAIVTLYNYMDPTTYETSSTRERTKPTPKVLPVMSFGFTGQLCTAKAENKAENNTANIVDEPSLVNKNLEIDAINPLKSGLIPLGFNRFDLYKMPIDSSFKKDLTEFNEISVNVC